MTEELFGAPDLHWTPVSWQLRQMRRVVLLCVVASVVVALRVVARRLPEWSDVADDALLGVVGLALIAWVMIGRIVRSWGYAERGEELYVRRGALYREMIAVPYGRMQYVEVTAGPVEQLFGLARIRLHTASARTEATIPGLTRREAARLRDRLTELGEAQAAGL